MLIVTGIVGDKLHIRGPIIIFLCVMTIAGLSRKYLTAFREIFTKLTDTQWSNQTLTRMFVMVDYLWLLWAL